MTQEPKTNIVSAASSFLRFWACLLTLSQMWFMSFPSVFSRLKEKQNYRRFFCSAGWGSQHTHPVSFVWRSFIHPRRLTSVNVQNRSPQKSDLELFFPQPRKAAVLFPLPLRFSPDPPPALTVLVPRSVNLTAKLADFTMMRKSWSQRSSAPDICGPTLTLNMLIAALGGC